MMGAYAREMRVSGGKRLGRGESREGRV